ncbi:MAG TPA: protein-methionine-sulfoxide reductase heme-binding subunit MsrQ [Gemmatimonadales bacterium]
MAITSRRVLKPAVFLLCTAPFALLLLDVARDALGAEPITEITHRTGKWGLTFLVITLAVTPVRRLTSWNRIAGYRRMLGLFAFFYVCLHFLTYIVLDQFFGFAFILEDIAERPYITVGFTSFVMLIPLAVTSTKGWIRRLGRRWSQLHRLAYLAAAGGVCHFLWLVKADRRRPEIYGIVLIVLLAARLRRRGGR